MKMIIQDFYEYKEITGLRVRMAILMLKLSKYCTYIEPTQNHFLSEFFKGVFIFLFRKDIGEWCWEGGMVANNPKLWIIRRNFIY